MFEELLYVLYRIEDFYLWYSSLRERNQRLPWPVQSFMTAYEINVS